MESTTYALVHAALGFLDRYLDHYWPKNPVHFIGRAFLRRRSGGAEEHE
jgi:hypothetical protein